MSSATVRLCIGKLGRELQVCPRVTSHVAAPCRPSWGGSLRELIIPHGAKLHQLVDVTVSFEEFKRVSGAAAIDAALVQLNARLAARGAPLLRRMLACLARAFGDQARDRPGGL